MSTKVDSVYFSSDTHFEGVCLKGLQDLLDIKLLKLSQGMDGYVLIDLISMEEIIESTSLVDILAIAHEVSNEGRT